MTPKVLFSDGLENEGRHILEAHKHLFDLEICEELSRAELLQKISSINVLSIRTRTKVDAQLLKSAKNLKLIGRAGTGIDHIDIQTVKKLGIRVMNTASANSVSAAELTIGLLLSVARGISNASHKLKAGEWAPDRSIELHRKTAGIIGLGRVGRLVATRLQAFGMRVIANDPYKTQGYADQIGVRLLSLEECLATADFLFLHIPLSKETRHLLGQKEFLKMKQGAMLLNTARGGVINETDLLAALDSGSLRAYATDVFNEEPLPKGHPFIGHAKIVMTPHMGAQTEEAQKKVSIAIASQIVNYFQTGDIENEVYE